MLLRRHRAAGTWQGEGAHADLCFMLWARDLDWSLIGNDNGAGVAYCHVKHSEWLMTIKVNAEEKRNWNHWFESSRSYIFPSTMMHTWTCMYIRMLGSFVLFFTVVALSVSPATW